MQPLILFAHGKESGPWGSKIRHLAKIARQHGAEVLSPDYSDLVSPDARVRRLLAMELPPYDRLVLAGSSMGGYVSTVASARLRPDGLFLMAPAFGMPGYDKPNPMLAAGAICVVHGWKDDIVPVERGIEFARTNHARLHVLDADHRLNSVLTELGEVFDKFLRQVLSPNVGAGGTA